MAAIRARDSSVNLPADLEARCGLVHVDNVVTRMHLAIEKLELISGTSVYPGFDLMTSCENIGLLWISAAKEMGFRGKVILTGVPTSMASR
jgi:hypothetical protein